MTQRFRDGESARLWLLERLDRLEEAVEDSADLSRRASLMTGDALARLEADPLDFRRTAQVLMRDLSGDITAAAATHAEREGFHVPALERLVLETVGRDAAHGRDVLTGLLEGLRERVGQLGERGSVAHETAQERLDEALAALDQGLERVVQRWESAPLGFWNRWRRRRRLKKQGLSRMAELPELQLALAEAARERRTDFEQAWDAAAEAGRALGVAQSYEEVLDWLVDVSEGLTAMARHCRTIARDAAQRRSRLAGAWREEPAPDRRNLLDERLLDKVLDELGVTAEAWMTRSDAEASELGSESRSALEGAIARWAEVEAGRLPEETLARVLAGFEDEADAAGPLVELMTAGQPLVRFNDDLHRLWPEGLPAQYYVIAEAGDASVQKTLGDACLQVGLPAPLHEVREDAGMRLRVVQMVGGLAWLSAAERLMPMVEVHAEVMREADKNLETREGLRAALRDARESESLEPLLPDEVMAALRELRGLKQQVAAAHAPVRREEPKPSNDPPLPEAEPEAEAEATEPPVEAEAVDPAEEKAGRSRRKKKGKASRGS